MAEVKWNEISTFDRHEKLKLKVDEVAEVTFLDDGNFVSKRVLEQSGSKFPRDSYVFIVDTKKDKKEIWVAVQAYSTMNQLKSIRNDNGDTLKGAKVKIKRVSDSPKETNYEFEKI